ncbi:hypothetical protein A1O1_07135 [Capronia coronata CBS 617.96]|uniref:Uncharacterized protein n=1 Tax=Capronia coronata CBS 617.96 TaxID=1182541 RepID=W9XSI7_9EURO|nr:uncharacterized protein A1O1_07135 [Capronia coronata CBS 617.96]EXJ83512.1 hypothetical protein A1O1_07135 [Capronia coronata CBS 617.96]
MESDSSSGSEDHISAPDHGYDLEPSSLSEGHADVLDGPILPGSQRRMSELAADGLHDDDIIGVSISRAQTHMRAPETPVAEKARALNLPPESFNQILTLNEEQTESDDLDESDSESIHNDPKPAAPVVNGKTSLSTDGMTEDDEPSGAVFGSHSRVRNDTQIESPRLSSKRAGPQRSERAGDSDPESSQPRRVESPLPHHSENGGTTVSQNEARNPPPRLSLAKAFLNAAEQRGRGRSFSSSTTMFSNLRKYLPDLPSPSLPSLPSFNRSSISLIPFGNKNTDNSDHEHRVQSPPPHSPVQRSATFRWTVREPVEKQDAVEPRPASSSSRPTSDDIYSPSRPVHQADVKDEPLLSPISPASTRSRARSNSESSLYLMKRVSGMSTWDDINAYADVREMSNSRLKAITDSFQNSSLRLPKLPNIRPIPKRRNSPARPALETIPADNNEHVHDGEVVSKIGSVKKDVYTESADQRAHPVLARALSKTTGDVVVLGGYRGSILRSAQPPHRQLWVPIKVGLNLRKVDLEVGLTREDEERMEETVIPSGILSHVGPIDICRRLLRHLRKCPNARDNKLRSHDWGYDWRLSPDLLSARLIKFLESLECNQPGTPPEQRGATVVAHSLGGLITRHAVNQRPELFAGVVYAGVPQNCVNILGPMRNGDDVLLSSKVLTAQVNFSFRTSYALLPDDGRCFLQKQTNKRYDLDFFDPHVWDEYRLSPCVNLPLHHHHHRNNERRKSLMDAISDSISISSSTKKASGQQLLEAANPHLADKAMDAARATEDPGQGMVGPSTMKQSQYPPHRPSVATACTIPKDVAMEYLGRTLREVRAFKDQLKFNPVHQENNVYPPHGFIFGKTVPTVYGARVANKEAIKYDDAYDDLAFAAGDGVVLASAAQLPDGYRCVKGGRVESDRGHVGILGDLEGVGRCLEAVVDARAKGVGLGKDALHQRGGRGE